MGKFPEIAPDPSMRPGCYSRIKIPGLPSIEFPSRPARPSICRHRPPLSFAAA